ncbi:LOW QUALITY PROTEIN: 60S ribosomal protein L7-like 1 [Pholidichthys leucotaenia]
MADSETKKAIKLVPEYLLKKRKTYQAIKATQAKLALQEKRRISKGKIKFKRLEEFLKESHKRRRDDTRIHRVERRPAEPLPVKSKLAFAVRIREIKGVSPKVIKVIQMMRLRKIFSGAFVKINKTSVAMMMRVEPYVALGIPPTLKSVRELILKRGQTRMGQEESSLTDNTFIEQHMGKHGIICLEDLIHEIYSVGKGFRAANNFLLPFKLSVARHSMRDKAGLLKDLGNPGFRGTEINSIIRQLN